MVTGNYRQACRSWKVAVVAVLAAGAASAALLNGDFESGQGSDIPHWTLSAAGRKIWRVEAGAGVNGNRGLVWECAQTNIYAFPTQRIELKPGRRYRISAQVKPAIRKIGSGSYGAGVFLEWYDKDGKSLGSCYAPRARGSNDWVTIEDVTKKAIGGDVAYGIVGAFVHKGCVGYAAFDDIEITEYAVKPLGGLHSSAYRDTAKDGRITFFAPLFVETNGFRSADWKAEFRYVAADGARRAVAAERVTPEFVSLSLDVAELAMGRQLVECGVSSADGRTRDSAELEFTRVEELPKRKVYVDARRRLIVDGKPFFPLGLYSSVLRPPVVSAYAKGPFNCVMPYHSPNLKQLDDCEAHGIKVIYALNKTYAGWRSAPKGVKSEADEIRWIEGRMAFAKDHPAMLAWYLADELAVSYVPRLAKRRAWLAERDPDHPTFACYCRYDQMREYLPTVDIFGTDIYPVPNKALRTVADITRVTDDGLFRARSLWQVPQTFSWAETQTTLARGTRFPTRAEMRSMCWQMVAAGANGLIGYCLHQCIDRFTGKPIDMRWDDVCAVFSDLKRFSHVFLCGGEPPLVQDVPKSLAVRTFREGSDVWALVCNLENAAVDASFSIDGVTGESSVEYGAGVHASDGKVEVSMTPFDVCLIRFHEKSECVRTAASSASPPAVVIREGADWVACDYGRDVASGSALDFSSRLDAPAGKHGWLRAVGGHFEFERLPGVAQRFHGINVCMDMNFPEKGDADILVECLARMGYNSIRIHHHDRLLTQGAKDGVALNAANLEKFDYLYAAAIRRGLYLTTDLFVSRRVKWRDIGEDRDGDVEKDVFKALTVFHDGAFANWAAFSRNFLEHVNPYTGRAYRDEPALPLICLVNEGWIGKGWSKIRDLPCVSQAYDAWRRKKLEDFGSGFMSHSLATHAASANCYGWKNAATALFLAESEQATIGRKISFLRSIGCKALLTTGNHGPNNAPNQRVRATSIDYVDVHSYEDHPKHLNSDPHLRWKLPSSCPNRNPIDALDDMHMAKVAWSRVDGRPFTVTEWNFCGPAFHRSFAGLYGGSLAGLQGWDGVWRFAYGHSARDISAPQSAPGYFNVANDPIMAATGRMMANLFLRGDMPLLDPKVNLVIDGQALMPDGTRKGCWEAVLTNPSRMDPIWRARVSCGACDVPDAKNFPLSEWGMRFGATTNSLPIEALPPSSCVRLDPARRLFAVETERTCGVFAPSGTSACIGRLSVSIEKAEAAVAVTSLDGAPISTSSRLLLSHLTDAHGSGCAFEDESCTTCVSFGSQPILIKDGCAAVSLKLGPTGAFKVYALALDGKRRFEVPSSNADGVLSFTAKVRGLDGLAVLEYEIELCRDRQVAGNQGVNNRKTNR